MRQEATWVACLMNATGNFKEPVTPDMLLKPKGENVHSIDMEKIRLRAEQRRRERIAERQHSAE